MHLTSLIPLLSIFAFSSVVYAQQTAYGQCGGSTWTGPKTCVSGYTCVYSNEWYSQCVPGSSTPTSTTKPPSTTSTRPPTTTSTTPASTGVFRNPLRTSNGSDPFMVYSNGYYYLITTTWSNLQLMRGRTLAELKASSPKTIWTDSNSSRCCNFWAGEIHSINGVWYIYYTGGPKDDSGQRIHVIKASSTDLWSSTWSYAGRLAFPNRDVWSIDPTVLKLNGNNYVIYSTQDSGAQCLFIAQLTSPTTVGNAYVLSRPTLSWEKVGWNVNEGPVALYRNNRTWVAFSASLCSGTGYKLGLLEYIGGDPLSISSWNKYSQPVLQSANGNYQPGHNGFFLSPSGQQWIVFHANSVTPGQCDGSRYTMAQPVEWNSDGTPRFQPPAPLSSNIPEPV